MTDIAKFRPLEAVTDRRRGIALKWVVVAPVIGALAWLGRPGPVPVGTRWPHEPDSLQLISEQPWDAVPSLGWRQVWGPSQVIDDPTAPGSPPSVLQIRYPAGFQGGSAPGTVVRTLPDPRQIFVGMWWRTDGAWQGHESNVNKLQFLFPVQGGDVTMVMYGPPGGPYEMRVIPQFLDAPSEWLIPNAARVPLTLGTWHRVEWSMVASSTEGARDGICRWWVDGQLVGAYTGLIIPSKGFMEYKLSPTWGGVGDVKRIDNEFRFDEIRLAGQ